MATATGVQAEANAHAERLAPELPDRRSELATAMDGGSVEKAGAFFDLATGHICREQARSYEKRDAPESRAKKRPAIARRPSCC